MADDFPRCPQDVCNSLPATLAKQCHDSGYGPDHPVAVVVDKTTICHCSCSDAVGESVAPATGIIVDEVPLGTNSCGWMECEFDPLVIKLCQGQPAGRSVILHSGSPERCNCTCWGGPLAPYQVMGSKGKFMALDQLPVGGFVAACGLDLKWYNVPVGYASRPRQAAPQKGIHIKIGEIEMLVPRTHIFLTLQNRLIAAHQLIKRILLMGADGEGVVIDEIEEVETSSIYQFIATSEEAPLEDLRYHLLNSQGVVSADYAVQRAFEEQELPVSRLAFGYRDTTTD